VALDEVLGYFKGDRLSYRDFVEEGIPLSDKPLAGKGGQATFFHHVPFGPPVFAKALGRYNLPVSDAATFVSFTRFASVSGIIR
jgi:hypothetical protein